jgi:hypothetical protein
MIQSFFVARNEKRAVLSRMDWMALADPPKATRKAEMLVAILLMSNEALMHLRYQITCGI